MAAGWIGGVGCSSLALGYRGWNASGLRTGVVSLISGGETVLGVKGVWESKLNRFEKKMETGAIILLGASTGIVTDLVTGAICPELSVPRALCVTMVGFGAATLGKNPALARIFQCVLGTAGRSAFYAGVGLVVVSSANWLWS